MSGGSLWSCSLPARAGGGLCPSTAIFLTAEPGWSHACLPQKGGSEGCPRGPGADQALCCSSTMKRAGWEPSYLFPRVLCLCQLEKHSQSRAKEGLGLELLLFQGTTSLVLRPSPPASALQPGWLPTYPLQLCGVGACPLSPCGWGSPPHNLQYLTLLDTLDSHCPGEAASLWADVGVREVGIQSGRCPLPLLGHHWPHAAPWGC